MTERKGEYISSTNLLNIISLNSLTLVISYFIVSMLILIGTKTPFRFRRGFDEDVNKHWEINKIIQDTCLLIECLLYLQLYLISRLFFLFFWLIIQDLIWWHLSTQTALIILILSYLVSLHILNCFTNAHWADKCHQVRLIRKNKENNQWVAHNCIAAFGLPCTKHIGKCLVSIFNDIFVYWRFIHCFCIISRFLWCQDSG